MWVRMEIAPESWVYIAICYFPPGGSRYAGLDPGGSTLDRDSPYIALSDQILHYSTLGEVFLMGDFNGRTQSRQCESYDMDLPQIMRNSDQEEMSTSRVSADVGQDATGYGRHLLELGSRHNLVIYNGIHRWPGSGGLTCFPHGGGENTVDYILGTISGASLIPSLSIGRRPLGADHTFITFTLSSPIPLDPPSSTETHTTIHFTHELSHIYAHHLHTRLLSLDPLSPLDTLTSQITTILQDSALLSFPHRTYVHPPRRGSMPQNRWYDAECRELRKHLQILEHRGDITHAQSQRRMQILTRRKRREWEERQYWDIYHLLMSRDSVVAWRHLRERR
ncbi:hypothetical protein KP509_1Z160900 [Ceratopteris richardii]|nr:hypothetical protein KP509_1Z160900 [Ceratopteris richardii]